MKYTRSSIDLRWFTHFNEAAMMNYNDGYYFGWGWFLWLGFIILMFSSFGNWGYSYRAHRKFDNWPDKDALAILKERYAAGKLTREQYLEQKSDIAAA
ncbi:SHOCT domain-containing protein [Novosphingobium sp. FSW06-99]|uniref:SHOCT domain-containing protein n=1 Tax=Novosphingobium sp. FSW06-99 TaxID=1739113 RepID=UPI001E452A89|nr:SHOCT domain-containing protein [Novosphingobium sp. FSW06-99]